MSPRLIARLALALAWLVAAWALLLHGLAAFGLTGPDEPRYAEIAAEMLARHAWITPRLLGHPWLEKPVLLYWLAAAGDRLAGIGTLGSRLPNALLALLLIAGLAYFLACRHSERAGWLAAFIGIGSAFILGLGRACSTDMTLTAPLVLGQLLLFVWLQRQESGAPRAFVPLAGAAILIGLATLAKGPVAIVLAGGTFLFYTLAHRVRGAACWRWLLDVLAPSGRPWPVLLLLAVAAPWYVLVSLHTPAFPRVFFLQHNLERFATNRFHHRQPFWFYLPVLLAAVFPWTAWLAYPLLRLKRWRQPIAAEQQPVDKPGSRLSPHLYLAIAAAVPLVFFSLAESKLPAYVLPSVPFLIALIAVGVAESWETAERWPLFLTALLGSLVPIALRLLPWGLAPKAAQPPLTTALHDPRLWLYTGVALLALLAAAWWRRMALQLALLVGLMVAAVLILTGPERARVDAAISARPAAATIATACAQPLPPLTRSPAQAAAAAQPLVCAGLPVRGWHLSRETRYGIEFYFHRKLPSQQPGRNWPPRALLFVPQPLENAAVQAAMVHASRLRIRASTPAWIVLQSTR